MENNKKKKKQTTQDTCVLLNLGGEIASSDTKQEEIDSVHFCSGFKKKKKQEDVSKPQHSITGIEISPSTATKGHDALFVVYFR